MMKSSHLENSKPLTSDTRAGFLADMFQKRYGAYPEVIFRAPGRVAILGGHVDFMDGCVLPAAIDRDVMAAVSLNGHRRVDVHTCNLDRSSAFDLDDIRPCEVEKWSNYVRGVFDQLIRAGVRLPGMRIMVDGNLPRGGGLSSSAALEVAVSHAALSTVEHNLSGRDIARICQRAENEFVGVKTGIMDQFVSTFAQDSKVMFLDCRTLEYDLASLPPDTCIVVCDTLKPRSLHASAYNRRRAQCDEAVRLFQQWIPEVKALRDVSPEQFEEYRDRLPEETALRARHVIYEIRRCREAFAALTAGRYSEFGALMGESHHSSRLNYQSTIDELDWLQQAAEAVPGCVGSRLTGAGFGGFTVSIVHRDAVADFRRLVSSSFRAKAGYEPEISVMKASGGAARIA